MSFDDLCEAIENALADVLDDDDYDVTIADDESEATIEADDWTLQILTVPVTAAFLALDDEPDDAAAFPAARRAVMSEAVEHALGDADRAVGGFLSAALLASGDPFSASFAAALRSVRDA